MHHFGPTPAAAAGLVLTAALVAASGIDLRDRLLPDSIVLPLLWLGLLLSVNGVFVHSAQAILGAAAGYLSLWSVFWLHRLLTGREGLGYGDFKLMAVAGAWFGPQAILPVVFLAACLISVLGLIHLRRTGQGADTHLAFRAGHRHGDLGVDDLRRRLSRSVGPATRLVRNRFLNA